MIKKKLRTLLIYIFLIFLSVNAFSLWINEDYTIRYPINFGATHGEINTGYTLKIESIDTSNWICFDNNQIAVGWQNGVSGNFIDANIEGGICGTSDLNILFRAQFDIPSDSGFNSSDINGYYIYVTNNVIASPLRDLNNVYRFYDSFEDGNHMENPTWTTSETGSLNQFNPKTSVCGQAGIYCFEIEVEGSGSGFARTNITSDSNFYGSWINSEDVSTSGNTTFSFVQNAAEDNTIGIGIDRATSTIKYYANGSGNAFSPALSASNATWYYVLTQYSSNDVSASFFIYDSSMVLLRSVYNVTIDTPFPVAKIMIQVNKAAASTDSSFFDAFKSYHYPVPAPVLSLSLGELSHFDVNVIAPTNILSTQNVNLDGNHSIDFNVQSDFNYLNTQIYLSSIAGQAQNLLFDYNLTNIALNPSADANCGSSSLDFSSVRTCHLDWNIMQIFKGDGNFFIDINVSTNDINILSSSASSFAIDTNKPSVTWDGNNAVWQHTDANIHLTCVDDFCDDTTLFYRIDSSSSSAVSLGENTLYDTNIFFSQTILGDGNYEIDFNVTDLAGNTSDLNVKYIYLDNTAPTIAINSPVVNTTTPNQTFNFIFNLGDGFGSKVNSCDYNAFNNNDTIADHQNQHGTLNDSKTQCTISFSSPVLPNTYVDVNVNVIDQVALRSVTLKSKHVTYIPASPGPGGDEGTPGGGGGSGPQPEEDKNILTPSLVSLVSSTLIIELPDADPRTYYITITSLISSPLTVDISFSDEIARFMTLETPIETLEPGASEALRFSVQSSDVNFSATTGQIIFNLNNGQAEEKVQLTVRPSSTNPVLDFLLTDIAGFPVIGIVLVIIVMFFSAKALGVL